MSQRPAPRPKAWCMSCIEVDPLGLSTLAGHAKPRLPALLPSRHLQPPAAAFNRPLRLSRLPMPMWRQPVRDWQHACSRRPQPPRTRG